jgi:hypothetical protein
LPATATRRSCSYEAIAFRALAGNSTPDHVTIARFRVGHEQALAGLLVASLKLCATAGMERLELIALDGTGSRPMPPRQPTAPTPTSRPRWPKLPSQAARADQAEDHEHGTAGGDELPRVLAGRG